MEIIYAIGVCLTSWWSRKDGKEMKNISYNMLYVGKKLDICNHYCNKRAKKTDFFDWFTALDNKFIKTMCIACALREAWGYSYKQNKHYKKWVGK